MAKKLPHTDLSFLVYREREKRLLIAGKNTG